MCVLLFWLLRYIMLCIVMCCYVLLCIVMYCYVGYATLCFVMLCNAMQFNVMHVYIYIQNLVAIIPSMACGYHFLMGCKTMSDVANDPANSSHSEVKTWGFYPLSGRSGWKVHWFLPSSQINCRVHSGHVWTMFLLALRNETIEVPPQIHHVFGELFGAMMLGYGGMGQKITKNILCSIFLSLPFWCGCLVDHYGQYLRPRVTENWRYSEDSHWQKGPK